MIHLAYTSTAVDLMNTSELKQIFNEARERNEEHNVTGMLLYRDSTFLQVLEGDEDDVLNIYNLIKSDNRHRGLINVLQGPIEERDFQEWRMGFRQIESADLEEAPDGYTRFMENGFEADTFNNAPNGALEMLTYFRDE